MVHSHIPFSVKSTMVQVAASVVANWGIMINGIVLGFPSAVVPPLLGSGPGLHVTVDEASWVASITFLSAPVACLLAGPIVDFVGRRWGLQLLNTTYAVSWLLLALFPYSLFALYVGRLLSGVALGMASCMATTYTAEIATAALRTTLVSLTPVMMASGTFIVYLWAAIYQDTWSEVSYFTFGLCIWSLVLTPLLPESPLWLTSRNRSEEALLALLKLRAASDPEQVKQELEQFSNKAKDKQQKGSLLALLKTLTQPQVYKPLIFLNIFFLFTQLSGMSITVNFAVSFVQNAGIDGHTYFIVLGLSVMRVLSTFVTTWACSKYGKRLPALVTGVVSTLSLTIVTVSVSHVLTLPSWFIGVCVLIHMFCSSVVFSALPWSMLGEIFPTNARGIASGFTASLLLLESFCTVKLYPGLVLSIGVFPIFLLFSISAGIGTFYLYLYFPETHGLSLLEIEESFKGSKHFKNLNQSTRPV